MKRSLAALLTLVAVPACVGVTQKIANTGLIPQTDVDRVSNAQRRVTDLRPFGWEEERAIGGAVAMQAVAKFGGPYRNKKVQRYVQTVGTAVAQLSDRPTIPYHFMVLQSPQPNAFAAPGGYVFVTVGLLKMLRSESELAGILGHEIAHITNRHALKVIRRAETIATVAEVSSDFFADNPEAFDGVVRSATDTIFNRGFDQFKEAEADRHGVEFAWRVGYDPHAAADFLDRLAAKEGKKEFASFKIFSTHPSNASRVKKLRAHVTEKYGPDAGGVKLQKRYRVRTRWVRAPTKKKKT